MSPHYFQAIQALNRCRFLPGSAIKRFVRSMGVLGEYDLLTPRQEKYVDDLLYRYRKQLSQQIITSESQDITIFTDNRE